MPKSMAKRPAPKKRSQANSGLATVSLRIPVSMIREIDAAVKERPYKTPRHMWLLEAIHEKLLRIRHNQLPQTEPSG